MKRILILNAILFTPENGRKMISIRDSLMVTVCKGFVEAGYMPTLIADEYYKPGKNENFGFEIIYLKHSLEKIFSPFKMPFPKGLYRYIKKHIDDYDFIITSDVFSWYSFMVVIVSPQKMIVWHELALHNKMLKGYASRIWYGVVGKCLFKNVLIAPRSENAKRFISKYCLNVDKNIYQHPINKDEFKTVKSKRDEFVSVSQLIERKRVDKIISVFAEFHREHPNYTLNICGDGDERMNLEQLVCKLNIEEAVKFHGLLDHTKISSMIRNAKAMLIYTRQDNSLLTISEAISSGTPVITTSVPDNSEFVCSTSSGIVKDEWRVEEMELIVEKNDEYISNCIASREELTNVGLAKSFIELRNKLVRGE